MVSMKNIYPCTLGNRPMGSIKEYGSNTTSNRSRVDPPGLIRIGSKNATLSSQTRIPTKSPVCTNRDTIVNSNRTIPYRTTVTGKCSGRGIYLSPLLPRVKGEYDFEEFSSGMRIRSDPLIFGPPDPVLFSTDPDLTCNNGFLKLFFS